MVEEKKYPKKILRNYIMFDVTHALKETTEDNSLDVTDESDSKKLGAVIAVGAGVVDIKVGDEVYIPDTPHINPLMLKLEGSTFLLFREADVVAII